MDYREEFGKDAGISRASLVLPGFVVTTTATGSLHLFSIDSTASNPSDLRLIGSKPDHL